MHYITVAPSTQALLQRIAGPAMVSKRVRHGPYIVDAVVLDAHPEIVRWYGYDNVADFRGRYLSHLHDARDLAQVRRFTVARKLVYSGVPPVYDIRIHLPNGMQRWLRKQHVEQLMDGTDTYWISQCLPIEAPQAQPPPTMSLPLSPPEIEGYLGRYTMAEAEGMIAQTLPLGPGQHGTFPVASVETTWLLEHLLGLSHGMLRRTSPLPKAQDVRGNRTDALPLRLPQRLRDLRRLQGLTQKALAQRAGITDVTISRIEQSPDASQVAIDTVVRLARALNVPLETLLGLDDEPPRD